MCQSESSSTKFVLIETNDNERRFIHRQRSPRLNRNVSEQSTIRRVRMFRQIGVSSREFLTDKSVSIERITIIPSLLRQVGGLPPKGDSNSVPLRRGWLPTVFVGRRGRKKIFLTFIQLSLPVPEGCIEMVY